MTRNRTARLICLFGRRGQGKTYRLREILSTNLLGLSNARHRFLVLDQVHEFGSLGRIRIPTYHSTAAYDRMARVPQVARFVGLEKDDLEAWFGWARNQGPVTVVADELGTITRANRAPEGLTDLSMRGRHLRVDLIGAWQRYSHAPRDVTSQADTILSFAVHEKADLEALEGRCGKAYAETVERLDPYWCASWTGYDQITVYKPTDRLPRLEGLNEMPESESPVLEPVTEHEPVSNRYLRKWKQALNLDKPAYGGED